MKDFIFIFLYIFIYSWELYEILVNLKFVLKSIASASEVKYFVDEEKEILNLVKFFSSSKPLVLLLTILFFYSMINKSA